jgi:hypothetical protein
VTPAIDLVLFATASFAASLMAGLAGFAFGLVAAALWLHVLTPVQTTALIVAFGLLVQGFSVWKLPRALNVGRLLPLRIELRTSPLLSLTTECSTAIVGVLRGEWNGDATKRTGCCRLAMGSEEDVRLHVERLGVCDRWEKLVQP